VSSGPQDATPGGEPVGSVSEEAAKLFGALSDWARDHGPDLAGDELDGLARRASAAAHEVSDHVATGAPECTWCPLCRTVHLVRSTNPEVRDHLAAAASSLMQAAAGFLAAAGAPPDRPRSPVEHIDLDEDPVTDWPEEDA
jgi:hypothetical protein